MRRALLFVAVAAGVAGCGSDAAPTGPAEIEVVRYDYAFDIETRSASAEITLRFTQPGDCVTLPVRAGGIDAAYFDGEIMKDGELSGGIMTACGPGWEAGEETVLSVDLIVADETWGGSQVGYSVSTDIEGQPFYYLVSWVGGCDRFGPCDAAPDKFATFRFAVTHPSGIDVLCPGTVTPGDTETVCEFDHDGGPTYSTFGIVASPSWQRTDLGDWGGVSASLYDAPSTGIAADFDTEQHREFLAWMTDNFGPYPYGDELRLITGPTYWNGFEHPGNITLNDRLNVQNSLYADPLAHTTNHELAHQWAGDQTTLATTHDFVWKEAMAEYLAYVFDDEHVDPNTAIASARAWKRFSETAEYHPVPSEQPALLDYYGDVYGPGPMILFRQIESLFSRDQVMSALSELLGSARAIGVGDVKTALEDATGADLGAYFEAWVFGEGAPAWPAFAVDIEPTGVGTEVSITLSQDNAEAGLFGAAFAVRLWSETSETHDVLFDLGPDGAAVTTITADPGFAVTAHTFDPHAQTLATELRDTATRRAAQTDRNPWVAGDWR